VTWSKVSQAGPAGGTITPLRLDFASTDLVYPLRLSSLNPGSTDIDLYLLADHRMDAPGFRTDFADDVSSPAPEARYSELRKLLTPGRTYLTELRATMESADMTHDITITRAATDEPYQATEAPGTGQQVTGRWRRPGYRGRRGADGDALASRTGTARPDTTPNTAGNACATTVLVRLLLAGPVGGWRAPPPAFLAALVARPRARL
jgi:hypothetical protein